MASEYIKLSGAERTYGEKNLLHSKMDIISMIKRRDAFQKLRKKEFMLKIRLKKQINDVLAEANALDKTLPKARIIKEQSSKKIKTKKKNSIISKKTSSLDSELAQIKKRLEKLQ